MDSVFAYVVSHVLVFVAGVVTGRMLHALRARRVRPIDTHEELYATGVRSTLGALRKLREDELRARREADAWRGRDSP